MMSESMFGPDSAVTPVDVSDLKEITASQFGYITTLEWKTTVSGMKVRAMLADQLGKNTGACLAFEDGAAYINVMGAAKKVTNAAALVFLYVQCHLTPAQAREIGTVLPETAAECDDKLFPAAIFTIAQECPNGRDTVLSQIKRVAKISVPAAESVPKSVRTLAKVSAKKPKTDHEEDVRKSQGQKDREAKEKEDAEDSGNESDGKGSYTTRSASAKKGKSAKKAAKVQSTYDGVSGDLDKQEAKENKEKKRRASAKDGAAKKGSKKTEAEKKEEAEQTVYTLDPKRLKKESTARKFAEQYREARKMSPLAFALKFPGLAAVMKNAEQNGWPVFTGVVKLAASTRVSFGARVAFLANLAEQIDALTPTSKKDKTKKKKSAAKEEKTEKKKGKKRRAPESDDEEEEDDNDDEKEENEDNSDDDEEESSESARIANEALAAKKKSPSSGSSATKLSSLLGDGMPPRKKAKATKEEKKEEKEADSAPTEVPASKKADAEEHREEAKTSAKPSAKKSAAGNAMDDDDEKN
jgi:hypothetical protein